MDSPNKWTIRLARYKLGAPGLAERRDGLYAVDGLRLNDIPVRCTRVTLSMLPKTPVALHLEIMPRDLEIIMEDEDGNQETNQDQD